ncbi:MAG: tetratricopeptide repeat protein, partial [Acidobacteriota bacterium]
MTTGATRPRPWHLVLLLLWALSLNGAQSSGSLGNSPPKEPIPAQGPTVPPPPPPKASAPEELSTFLGTASERSRSLVGLAPDAAHSYHLELRAGDACHLDIDPADHGDLIVEVHEPGLGEPIRFDRPGDPLAVESAVWVAPIDGRYRVEIKLWSPVSDGEYHLRRKTCGVPADARARQLDAAARAASTSWRLRRAPSGSDAEAVRRIDAQLDAAKRWRAVGDAQAEASFLFHAGRLERGRLERSSTPLADGATRAEDTLRRSIALYRQIRDRGGEAVAQAEIGQLYSRLDQVESALAAFRACVDLVDGLDAFQPTRAACHQHLGLANRRLGRFAQARQHYRQAIESWHRLDEPCHEALARSALGNAYQHLGQHQLALDEQLRAVALARSSCRRQSPVILTKLADALARAGSRRQAMRHLRAALDLRREQGDRRGEAVTLQSLAHLLLDEDFVEAEALYRQALALFLRFGTGRDQSTCRRALCQLYERAGARRLADDCYVRALATARQVGPLEDEAAVLLGMARLAYASDAPEVARRHIEAAVDTIEMVRAGSGSWPSDAYYLANQREVFTLWLDILAVLHRNDPTAGLDALAFAVSERSRARGLLDVLHAEAESSAETSTPSRLHLAALEAEIARLHAERMAQSDVTSAVTHLDREMRRHFAEIEESARTASRRIDRARPPSVPLEQLQRQVLDDRMLLLEYRLGPRQSYLWAVTRDGFRWFHDLPPQDQVTEAVRALRDRIHHREHDVLADEVADLLLTPVADLLADHDHVVIVPDDVLVGVPFSLLPVPGRPSARPLVTTHRVSSLPSVAVLGAIRRSAASRPSPAIEVVAVGDAV